jgi:hypothetical protein
MTDMCLLMICRNAVINYCFAFNVFNVLIIKLFYLLIKYLFNYLII